MWLYLDWRNWRHAGWCTPRSYRTGWTSSARRSPRSSWTTCPQTVCVLPPKEGVSWWICKWGFFDSKFYRLTVAVFTVGRFHLNGVMHLEKKMKNLIFFRIKQSAVAINVKVQRQRGAQKRNRKRNYFGRRPSIKRRCQTAGKSGKNPLMHYYCRWMLRPHVSFFFLFTTLHYDLDVSNPTNNFVEVRLFIFFNWVDFEVFDFDNFLNPRRIVWWFWKFYQLEPDILSLKCQNFRFIGVKVDLIKIQEWRWFCWVKFTYDWSLSRFNLPSNYFKVNVLHIIR